MKYYNEKTPYTINILYKNIDEIVGQQFNRFIWILYSLGNKYLTLDNCAFCTRGTTFKLTKYIQHEPHFILPTMFIKKYIDKYNFDDCLIVGNRLYFLESLLFYKINKIGLIPLCIDSNFIHKYSSHLSLIKENYPNKFIIEYEDTPSKYNNIIFYISSNIFTKKKTEISIHNGVVYNILEILHKLKKGGNLFFRILFNNNEKELSDYNIQLIYLLSTCFKNVEYLHEDFSAESPYLKNICIFENYNDNYHIFDEIVYKLMEIQNTDDTTYLSNFIDIKYDDNFIKFIKYLNSKLIVYSSDILQKYNENKNVIDLSFTNTNTYIKKFYDELYKIFFMKNLDNTINLCKKKNIEIINKFYLLSKKFKNKIKMDIVPNPIIKYFNSRDNYIIYTNEILINNYKLIDTHNYYDLGENVLLFNINLGNYFIMNMFISLIETNKIKKTIKKISMTDYAKIYLSKLLNFKVSIRFIKIYELISYFNLIDTKNKLKSIHISENDTDVVSAINHYYKQYNKTDDELLWKIYLKENNKSINKKNLLFSDDNIYDLTSTETVKYIIDNYQNIDFCTFDINIDEKYILITQIFICLLTLKKGGNGIFKIYLNNLDEIIVKYINILKTYFEIIYFSKSSVDMYENSEIYIVVKNKIKDIDEKFFQQQIEYINNNKNEININMINLNYLIFNPISILLKQEIKFLYIILYCNENENMEFKQQDKHNFIKKWIKYYGLKKI